LTRSLNIPLRWIAAAGGLALIVLALGAGSARAATYPAGGGAFSGGAEGWKASGKCDLELLLCTSTAKYDGAVGSPPGSLVSETSVLLSLAKLFHGEFAFESPQFTVAADGGGQGTLALQRAFDNKALVKLAPELSYTVSLVDKTNGAVQNAIEESTQAESGFLVETGSVALVAGHSYAIAIAGEVASTVTEVLTLNGTSSVNFDNVSLSGPGSSGPNGPGSGGNGADGGDGSGVSSLTDSKLESLMKSSLIGSAEVKGKRVFVKASCPAAVGRACKATVQGMLRKGKAATAPRKAKIAKGKSKQLVLKVKPKMRSAVAKRKRLLFKETVKAGKAKATIFKSLKLIRR
jgi:hypothetical protein